MSHSTAQALSPAAAALSAYNSHSSAALKGGSGPGQPRSATAAATQPSPRFCENPRQRGANPDGQGLTKPSSRNPLKLHAVHRRCCCLLPVPRALFGLCRRLLCTPSPALSLPTRNSTLRLPGVGGGEQGAPRAPLPLPGLPKHRKVKAAQFKAPQLSLDAWGPCPERGDLTGDSPVRGSTSRKPRYGAEDAGKAPVLPPCALPRHSTRHLPAHHVTREIPEPALPDSSFSSPKLVSHPLASALKPQKDKGKRQITKKAVIVVTRSGCERDLSCLRHAIRRDGSYGQRASTAALPQCSARYLQGPPHPTR